jgi:hypothetical protein
LSEAELKGPQVSKKSLFPQSRRHIFIYDEDWDFLDKWYSKTSPFPIGVGAACRDIIHQRVQFLKAKQNEMIDKLPARHLPKEETVG